MNTGRHTGGKAWDRARRDGIFGTAPSGLAIGTPANGGLGKAAVFHERTNRPDDTAAPWDEEEKAALRDLVKQIDNVMDAPVYTCQTREEWFEAWRTPEIAAALAEWRGMWGDAPADGLLEARRRTLALSRIIVILRCVARKHECGYWAEQIPPVERIVHPVRNEAWAFALAESLAATPDKPADKPADKITPDSVTASRNQPEIADRKPVTVLPQSLQDARDVTRDIVTLVTQDAPSVTEADADEAIAKALAKKGAENVDELVRDINHALESKHWVERVNQYGVVTLIDGCWLRKGKSGDIHLEAIELIEDVVVQTVGPDGVPFTTVNRGQIIEWLGKRKRTKGKPYYAGRPFAAKTSAPIGSLLIGVA